MSDKEEKDLIKKRASYKGRLTAFSNFLNDLDDSLESLQVTELQLRIGFGIKDILHYVLGGAGYGNYYPGQYPGYPGGQGHYPSGPSGPGGYYPGGGYNPGPPGPPGAHPGCPLCDSSVYSYCSHKEAHDACCCGAAGGSYGYGCRKADCKFLYANTCQEFNLISSCCCVDLHKNAIASPVIAPIA